MSEITWKRDDNGWDAYIDGFCVIATCIPHNRVYYNVATGLAEEPIPEGLTDDELKAWALTIYRMGGHHAE